MKNIIQRIEINQILIYVLLGLIIGYALYELTKTNKTKEKITNVDNDKNTVIAKQVYRYFIDKNNMDFVDYINFLTAIKNTNLNIIDLEVFYEFKLLKKNNKLTLDSILNAMKTLSDNKKNDTVIIPF
jgi:hypothetical protein